MIEQQQNKLILTFPTGDSAKTFAVFLATLLQPSPSASSVLSSVPESQTLTQPLSPLPDSPEPVRSHRVVLTDDRLEALFNQRQQGLTTHQRLLRAQATLRDGVLPFSKPGQQAPQSTGQPSPRQKAALEGTFADGAGEGPPEAGRRKGSRLRPAVPKALPSQ